MWDTPKPAPPMVLRSCFCTAGPTTFTASWTSRPCWRRRGYRVIVPYLRGYGTTRFLSGETMRNGQQSAVALDAIALMDALKIDKATLAGFDWGARTADIVAALWPERCKGLVSVSGYLIGSQDAGKAPLPAAAELNGGINSISPPSVVWSATTRTGETFQSSSGGKPRPNGTSTTPRSIAAQRPSRTPTRSPS
jgi:pimeloyl-ACP methyl ester carboxylesterase